MKYNIIYADPPWTFKTYSDKGKEKKSADAHYKTMSASDIQNLPINEIAASDSVLFLWVTFPCLKEGLELIEKWGFKYKTCAFNWVKKNKISDSWFWGLGYWTRSNSEICLLATKGKPQRISKSVHQVIDERIDKHSKKPDLVRNRIVELMGDLPRVELFARQQSDGWDVFGNEVENSIKLETMNSIELEIEIQDVPVNVTVDYQYYAGEPEVWTYSNGDPGHPGSGPEIDVLSVQDEQGNTVPDTLITQKWVDYIIEKCLDKELNR